MTSRVPPEAAAPALSDRTFRRSPWRRRLGAIAVALAATLIAACLTVLALGQTPTASAAPVLCDKWGLTSVEGGRYNVQNAIWGADTPQCIDVQGTGFQVTSAGHSNTTAGKPASYPSVYAGCHFGNCTSGNGLPLRVSDFGDVRSTFRVDTVDAGEWNASYDIWFDPTQRTDGQVTGTELMIWPNFRGSPHPVGERRASVTLEGATWDVWTGNIGWNVISYVRQQPSNEMRNFSINSFVDDAVNRGQIDRSWYMTSVMAGFEAWVGGTGLAVREFSFTTSGGGGGASGGDGGGSSGDTGGGDDGTGAGGDGTGDATPDSSPASPPSTDGDATGTGEVTGFGGLCLDGGAAVQRGGVVQVHTCLGDTSQQWTVGADGTLRLGDRCLAVPDGAANGTRVTVGACTGGSGQSWSAEAGGTVVNSGNGRCLDVASGTPVPGAEVQVYACRGDGTVQANQKWQLP